MSVEEAFRLRVRDVRTYLRSLQDIETRFSRPGRTFYSAASAVNASRASVYIMIYNCVEFGLSASISGIRETIHNGDYHFQDVEEYWQNDLLRVNFSERLRQGTNHAQFVVDMSGATKGKAKWKHIARDLPFSGNIDQAQLLRMRDQLGYAWKIPKHTLGGADLNLIRKHRNDLAHGEETFLNVGSSSDTMTLIEQLERIGRFFSSFLRMLERYQESRSFLRQP